MSTNRVKWTKAAHRALLLAEQRLYDLRDSMPAAYDVRWAALDRAASRLAPTFRLLERIEKAEKARAAAKRRGNG